MTNPIGELVIDSSGGVYDVCRSERGDTCGECGKPASRKLVPRDRGVESVVACVSHWIKVAKDSRRAGDEWYRRI